ncbi:MAG: ACT domain-containing protein [Alphaproteobacteria bacterium]
MAPNALISFIGPDRPALISKVTGRLFDLGGNLGEITFATLGEGAELTMIYEMPKDLDCAGLSKELEELPELAGGEVKVREFRLKALHGPSSRITHRIILAGGDRPGLVAKISKILDDHGANVVRMNAEKLHGSTGDQYISRFAISLREEKAPACLADIVKTAGEMNLTFRYETA